MTTQPKRTPARALTTPKRDFAPGDVVVILGQKRTLIRALTSVPGGWEINKPLQGFRFWHMGEFARPLSKGETPETTLEVRV